MTAVDRATTSAEPDSRLEIHPYIDASGQVAFEVVHHVFSKSSKFVQHRRPSGEEDQSWVLSLDAGEFMHAAPGEDWHHFDAARFERYPATRERKVFNAAPAILYRLRELREAIAAGRTIYLVPDEGTVDFCYDRGGVRDLLCQRMAAIAQHLPTRGRRRRSDVRRQGRCERNRAKPNSSEKNQPASSSHDRAPAAHLRPRGGR